MKKKIKLNISKFEIFHIKEAFEYFSTYDFTKLKFESNIKNVEEINLTLSLRNCNANKLNLKNSKRCHYL